MREFTFTTRLANLIKLLPAGSIIDRETSKTFYRLNLGWITVISYRKAVFRVRLKDAIFAQITFFSFSITKTGKVCPIKQTVLKLQFRQVIYLAKCKKWPIQYIGSTSTPFKVRFRNHKSSMITNKKTCEVAIHYNKIPHKLNDFEFVVMEQIDNSNNLHNIDELLLTREAYWCA